MTKLYAQPYDIDASGFYFDSVEEYDTKSKVNFNDYGQFVEEYEIQFIDGSKADCEIAEALGLYQGNIKQYFELIETDNEQEQITFIIAASENIAKIDSATKIGDFVDSIQIYFCRSMKELAEQFIDDGLLGEIPDHLQYYIDAEAYARDLSHDFSEISVLGQSVIYRAD